MLLVYFLPNIKVQVFVSSYVTVSTATLPQFNMIYPVCGPLPATSTLTTLLHLSQIPPGPSFELSQLF
jgi:hypothetical protein